MPGCHSLEPAAHIAYFLLHVMHLGDEIGMRVLQALLHAWDARDVNFAHCVGDGRCRIDDRPDLLEPECSGIPLRSSFALANPCPLARHATQCGASWALARSARRAKGSVTTNRFRARVIGILHLRNGGENCRRERF